MLKAFSLPPFKPIQQASVEALTYKALVLLALSLGARRGELISLHQDHNFIRPAENWSFVLLYSDRLSCLKQPGARSLQSPIS